MRETFIIWWNSNQEYQMNDSEIDSFYFEICSVNIPTKTYLI